MFTLHINDQISLKILEHSDAKDLYELLDKNRSYLRNWLSWVDSIRSYEDYLPIINSWLKQYCTNNGFTAAIIYNKKMIGMAGFHDINWKNQSTSIGYWLGSEYQGNGIITEICKVLVSVSFSTYNLNRVEIRVAEDNLKSRAIPERLGFQLEGKLRESEWLYDRFINHVIYSMVKNDWKMTQNK